MRGSFMRMPDAVAGDARLGDLEDGGADPVAVADADLVVAEALDGEVLAELPVDEVAAAELALPVPVGLDLVDEHGALLAAVPGQVALAVAVDVEPAAPGDGPVTGSLKTPVKTVLPCQRHVLRQADVRGEKDAHRPSQLPGRRSPGAAGSMSSSTTARTRVSSTPCPSRRRGRPVRHVSGEAAGRAGGRLGEQDVVPAPAAVHAPDPHRPEHVAVELETQADALGGVGDRAPALAQAARVQPLEQPALRRRGGAHVDVPVPRPADAAPGRRRSARPGRARRAGPRAPCGRASRERSHAPRAGSSRSRSARGQRS